MLYNTRKYYNDEIDFYIWIIIKVCYHCKQNV